VKPGLYVSVVELGLHDQAKSIGIRTTLVVNSLCSFLQSFLNISMLMSGMNITAVNPTFLASCQLDSTNRTPFPKYTIYI